jgi:hypothetical protein
MLNRSPLPFAARAHPVLRDRDRFQKLADGDIMETMNVSRTDEGSLLDPPPKP